ncbi:peptide chain release factor N(5)-glutamine methyltransferase [Peptacetobacter sp.]|uniref:peptide chain release factor N(5)-glutamine methyltransferase n=1 Tax=Peptacetobacter sp. TaxID=2991975 RepID=UPI0026039700|nr:peptide chain release factor N(5)-glutamine methyltransferase [Peptacetobacter sp.]
MTIREIILKFTNELSDISDTPRLDVEVMLMNVLGKVDKLYLHMNLNKEIEKELLEKLQKMVNERKLGRPVAYIVGNREFMGLDFYVQEGVLIPRPDTEILVEEIINICVEEEYRKKERIEILDIGTGSGAITVSLAHYIKNGFLKSFDISDIALKIGKKNAIDNSVEDKIEFIKSDVFSAMEEKDSLKELKFDIIVSNPPYIKKDVIPTLHTQVKDFEPYNALEGGVDGLDFYRKITEESSKYIKKGGVLAYEVGHDQAEDVYNIMNNNGFEKIYIKKDLAGIDRVVIGLKL